MKYGKKRNGRTLPKKGAQNAPMIRRGFHKLLKVQPRIYFADHTALIDKNTRG